MQDMTATVMIPELRSVLKRLHYPLEVMLVWYASHVSPLFLQVIVDLFVDDLAAQLPVIPLFPRLQTQAETTKRSTAAKE